MSFWAIDARARRTGEKIPVRTSLTGAEKRRARKGGHANGGAGLMGHGLRIIGRRRSRRGYYNGLKTCQGRP